MNNGYYWVKWPSGVVPVWLTNINGEMYHYKSSAREWELIQQNRIFWRVSNEVSTLT